MVKQNFVRSTWDVFFSDPLEEWEKLPVPQLGRHLQHGAQSANVVNPKAAKSDNQKALLTAEWYIVDSS